MSSENFYYENFDEITPEKKYRKFIDSFLCEKSVNSRKLNKKRKRKVQVAINPKRNELSKEVTIIESAKNRLFIQYAKYRQTVDDAIDNFLAICERSGLIRGVVTASSVENACLSKDSRFLCDELIDLIVKNKEIKEALGDLAIVIDLNKDSLIYGKKFIAKRSDVIRHSERVRRFFRAGANTYYEKLKEIEEGIDAIKEMSAEELNKTEGDLRNIANAVTVIAERIAKEIRRRDAQAGASEKLAKDPKQSAKQQVRECWDIWKSNPERYKSKSAFARDMLGKYEQLESSEVIQRWCREWDLELCKQS
ncbi:hypothetical protein [Comamonas sp. NoAH]|uniref:hypothetical protein n=1 Tax=Comamonas halotolerans TaxID=3041496 RepID=UPI0024E14A3D|nr:hypothetical protein [Comamonas sp. NoAH]